MKIVSIKNEMLFSHAKLKYINSERFITEENVLTF